MNSVEKLWKNRVARNYQIFEDLCMKSASNKIKILAVDDTPSNLIALEAVFSGTNYKIIEAHSGEEALAILATDKQIALVLLDVQMPEMDGFEVASKIKVMPGCSDLPIIFITAVFSEDPFIKKGYQAGAVDYFSKPFDPEILKLKVDMYSSHRQKANLLREREKRIEQTEELLKAGRKLSAILESLTVGVLIADQDCKIGQTNEVVTKILRTQSTHEHDAYGEILNWWESEGQALKAENGPIQLAIHKGIATHNKILDLRVIDGTSIQVLASASPLRNAANKIVGAVVVIQDVTESRLIEQAFEERLSNLISLGVELEHSQTNLS